MNHLKILIPGILLCFSLGCGRSTETKIANIPSAQRSIDRVVVDRLNREVRFNATPQRIISLMPAATELMYAIGAGPQLVGVTKNCNYPPEAERVERVGGGTMESISREKIVSLKPDLVLCKWDHHQPLMETLKQFNIPAIAIGPETLEELFGEATMLGDVTGHADGAKQLIAGMRSRVEKIEAGVSSIPLSQRRKVFYEVWDDPLMTAGPGSFIGEAIRLAGMQNIFEDATANYPKVSDEVVVSRNPDVIFSPSTHASRVSLDEMLQRQGWGEVTAIKQKQVFIVNGDHISRCGPRLLDAIEEMISLAYPNVGVPPSGSAGVQPLGARPGSAGIQPLGARPGSAGVQPLGARSGSAGVQPLGARSGSAGVQPLSARSGSAGVQPLGARPGSAGVQPLGARSGSAGVQPLGARSGSAGVQPLGARPGSAGVQPLGARSGKILTRSVSEGLQASIAFTALGPSLTRWIVITTVSNSYKNQDFLNQTFALGEELRAGYQVANRLKPRHQLKPKHQRVTETKP